uniref:Uncharacterized protein n=1 Tax=Strigamia maritima TaxID=126957 RepID=T1JNE8_STRMM
MNICHAGMLSLGAKDFNHCPVGSDTNEITLDTFTTEADFALNNLYAAYQTPKPESLISILTDKLLNLEAECEEIDEFECGSESDVE